MKGDRRWFLDGATILMGLVALGLAGSVVLERLAGARQTRNRTIDDWEEYSVDGHRLGSSDPLVTIIEWGDYQCPACRALAPRLEAVLEQYPAVALVYRHWPLPYHEHAYLAARAVECAADQQHFAAMHRALVATREWEDSPHEVLPNLAYEGGVADTAQYRRCLDDTRLHPAIERDITVVESLESRGTPTLMINGLLLGALPDSAGLHDLITRTLERERSAQLSGVPNR